jgi:hypothetical protein
MNIFILDMDTKKASEYHVDKHIVKMPLETAQMLCTSHHENSNLITPYKKTHINHPCNKWTRESIMNYRWLIELGLNLCDEYEFRYKRVHKCKEVILWCKENEPNLPNVPMTKFALAMPNEFKTSCAIESYRAYYNGEKRHIYAWKGRFEPSWVEKTTIC